jgi:hypothetical protein
LGGDTDKGGLAMNSARATPAKQSQQRSGKQDSSPAGVQRLGATIYVIPMTIVG